MATKTFRIIGHIIDRKTHQGVPGLQVEAWDKDLLIDDLIGSAVTDARGALEINFDTSYFRELFLDRKPDLYFKVFSGDRREDIYDNDTDREAFFVGGGRCGGSLPLALSCLLSDE